jgi:hypothetical protein
MIESTNYSIPNFNGNDRKIKSLIIKRNLEATDIKIRI